MNRREFLLGTGGATIGGSLLVGSGAVSGVVSRRETTISVAHDRDAYLGFRRSEGPNRSYVDYDGKHHLRLRMNEANPTAGGGKGINSDSLSWFDNLFHLCNQGKEKMRVFILKQGEYPERVTFYTGDFATGYEPIRGQVLKVSECLEVGLSTKTKSIKAFTQVLDSVLVVAVAEHAFDKNAKPEYLLERVDMGGIDAGQWVLNSQ